MTTGDQKTVGYIRARAVVDRLFADIRDRRMIKWLFDPDGTAQICEHVGAIDKDVQEQIRERWTEIVWEEMIR